MPCPRSGEGLVRTSSPERDHAVAATARASVSPLGPVRPTRGSSPTRGPCQCRGDSRGRVKGSRDGEQSSQAIGPFLSKHTYKYIYICFRYQQKLYTCLHTGDISKPCFSVCICFELFTVQLFLPVGCQWYMRVLTFGCTPMVGDLGGRFACGWRLPCTRTPTDFW